MRKKLFTFLLALAASVGMMNAAVDDSGSCGANVTYSFNGTTGEMVISGTGAMADYTSISDVPWNSYRDDITSVTITDGVTTVGSNSFGYHENLVTVTIGNDVETIGAYAFGDCYKFTTLNLGNSVRHIGDRAFMWAKVLTGFTLPSTLETIGKRAFLQNKVITSLTIPSNVTSIGDSAFFYCTALTSITTEATTPPTLGAIVFKNVPTSIPLYVPNGSVAAYEAAAQWTDFDIQGSDPSDPGSGEEPGGGSTNPSGSCGTNLSWEFNPATGTLTITGSGAMPTIWDTPASVSWHEYRADITSVSLPDGLTTIGGYAFYSCPGLTSVTIPENVTNIAIAAFANCANLASVTLPNSVLSIGQSALALCPSMTSLTLGSGLSSIGTAAFSGCSGLESVTNYATTPQVLDSYAFYNVEISNCELYVPEESVAAYQAATTWKDFKNVQAISGGSTPDPVDPTPAGPIPCTAADLGKVLCTDGSIYATVSEATAASKTVAAVITYVDTENGKALALALANESGTMDWETAKTTAAAHTPAVSGGTWTLPSKDDWNNMINAAGGYAALLNGFSAVGGTNIQEAWYWTSTEYDWDAFACRFDNGVYIMPYPTGDPCYVRACLAFDIPAAVNITPYADPQDASVYYSTFYDSAKKYALPAGVEAYVADLSGANLLLTKIAGEGQTIPADNAVILKSSVDQFTLTVSDADAVTFTATNDLLGVDAETAAPANCYVLSGTNEYGVGFYRINSENLKAHKAYVIYTGSAAPKRMRFVFNQTTDVESIQPSAVSIQKILENGQVIIIRNGVRYNAAGQIVK